MLTNAAVREALEDEDWQAGDYNPDIHATNSMGAERIFQQKKVVDEDVHWVTRYRGDFAEEYELEDFPFDIQDFHVEIMACAKRPTRLHTMMEHRPDNPSIFQYQNFGMRNVWDIQVTMGRRVIRTPRCIFRTENHQ